MDRHSYPCRKDGVLQQRSSDEFLLLDVQAGTYFSLNDVGGFVWELCDGNRTVDDVVREVVAQYDAPEDEIAADVLELLADLAAETLVLERS